MQTAVVVNSLHIVAAGGEGVLHGGETKRHHPRENFDRMTRGLKISSEKYEEMPTALSEVQFEVKAFNADPVGVSDDLVDKIKAAICTDLRLTDETLRISPVNHTTVIAKLSRESVISEIFLDAADEDLHVPYGLLP